MRGLALSALLAIASIPASATTQVVCTHKVAAHHANQSISGNYTLSWASNRAESPHDWQAVGATTPGGPYTFAKAGPSGPGGAHPVTMPAGNVCAIFRDGVLDRTDPFNIASGVVNTGLPLNSTHKTNW